MTSCLSAASGIMHEANNSDSWVKNYLRVGAYSFLLFLLKAPCNPREFRLHPLPASTVSTTARLLCGWLWRMHSRQWHLGRCTCNSRHQTVVPDAKTNVHEETLWPNASAFSDVGLLCWPHRWQFYWEPIGGHCHVHQPHQRWLPTKLHCHAVYTNEDPRSWLVDIRMATRIK